MADTPETPEPVKPASALPEPAAPKIEPLKPEGVAPAAPAPAKTPERWGPAGNPAPAAGLSGSQYTPPRPKRTSAEIRADIDSQREQLGQNVDHLRDKVTELTDWRSQLMKHRKKIVVGAVATGFVVGGLMALRRR